MLTIDALIRVPDIGTFHYVGRAPDNRNREILRAALEKATLKGAKRDCPYSHGVTMYASSGEGQRRLRETFGTIDSYTTTAEMTLVSTTGDGPSEGCIARMERQTRDNLASIVSVLNEYSGVYVASWEIGGFVPDSALGLLRN